MPMTSEFYVDAPLVDREIEPIEELDLDSCRQLYLSIIELAVHDYRFLQKMQSQKKSSRYDRKDFFWLCIFCRKR